MTKYLLKSKSGEVFTFEGTTKEAHKFARKNKFTVLQTPYRSRFDIMREEMRRGTIRPYKKKKLRDVS